jgi:hypothetical protein
VPILFNTRTAIKFAPFATPNFCPAAVPAQWVPKPAAVRRGKGERAHHVHCYRYSTRLEKEEGGGGERNFRRMDSPMTSIP